MPFFKSFAPFRVCLFEGVCETHVILIPGACGTEGLNCSLWTVSPGPPESGCKFQRVRFCAQAPYLRALGLQRNLRWTQNLQCCPETPLRRPNGDPGVPKFAPRLSKVLQRGHKGSQKRDKRSAMQSPKHAVALQSEFKEILYTPKLPINRTSGHHVNII